MRSSTDVLVIGAGPGGLLLACELHRRDRAPDALGLGRPLVAHRSRLRERLERGYHVLLGYLDRFG